MMIFTRIVLDYLHSQSGFSFALTYPHSPYSRHSRNSSSMPLSKYVHLV